MKKILRLQLNEKVLAIILLCILVVAMIPLLFMTKYACPCADDYTYPEAVHAVVEAGGNIWNVLGTAYQNTKLSYYQWQGTFTSIFLMNLAPHAFSESIYFLGPIFIFIMFLVGNFVISYTSIVKLLGCRGWSWMSVASILTLLQVEFVYTPASAFYWYNAAIHYTFMYSVLLLSLSFLLLAFKSNKGKRIAFLILSSILSFIASGGNYVGALLTGVVITSVLLIITFRYRCKAIVYWLPFVTYAIGFVISAIAPGNQVRGSLFNGKSAIESILLSFQSAAMLGVEWFNLITLCVLATLVTVAWFICKKTDFKFRMPGIVLLYSFCIYASTFTPGYFSTGVLNVPRALNISKFTYQILLLFNTLYFTGWFQKRVESKGKETKNIAYLLLFAILAATICVRVYATEQKDGNYTTYAATQYIVKGYAQRFRWEYLGRLTLMESEDKNIIIQPYSLRLHMLYVDDITSDVSDWRNQAMMRWYHKDSIILNE